MENTFKGGNATRQGRSHSVCTWPSGENEHLVLLQASRCCYSTYSLSTFACMWCQWETSRHEPTSHKYLTAIMFRGSRSTCISQRWSITVRAPLINCCWCGIFPVRSAASPFGNGWHMQVRAQNPRAFLVWSVIVTPLNDCLVAALTCLVYRCHQIKCHSGLNNSSSCSLASSSDNLCSHYYCHQQASVAFWTQRQSHHPWVHCHCPDMVSTPGWDIDWTQRLHLLIIPNGIWCQHQPSWANRRTRSRPWHVQGGLPQGSTPKLNRRGNAAAGAL